MLVGGVCGGHLTGSNVHCASQTRPNLCMSDVWSVTADRTNCLRQERKKMFGLKLL